MTTCDDILLTLFLQQILHFSPLKTGLGYAPFGLGMVVGIFASTMLLPRAGARVITTAALVIGGFGMLRLGGVSVHSTYVADLLPTILLLSFGMGAAFPALQIAAMHQVSKENAGLGSAVQNTVLQIGGSLGLAVLVTLALRRASSAIAAGTAPAAVPRQPAWTAPTAPVRRSPSSTGTQSATRTTIADCGCRACASCRIAIVRSAR